MKVWEMGGRGDGEPFPGKARELGEGEGVLGREGVGEPVPSKARELGEGEGGLGREGGGEPVPTKARELRGGEGVQAARRSAGANHNKFIHLRKPGNFNRKISATNPVI